MEILFGIAVDNAKIIKEDGVFIEIKRYLNVMLIGYRSMASASKALPKLYDNLNCIKNGLYIFSYPAEMHYEIRCGDFLPDFCEKII